MFEKKEINNSLGSLKRNVKQKQRLVIENEFQEVAHFNDIEPLYLFPLSISHYAKALKTRDLKRVKINIISIDENLNYKNFLEQKENQKLKHIEILIKTIYSAMQLKQIKTILELANLKKIRTTLLFEDLTTVSDEFLKATTKNVSFFKIMIPNILGTTNFDIFTNKLAVIKKHKTSNSLVLVKAYLNEEQSKFYLEALKAFETLGVDIFQVSKELLPLGKENPKVSKDVQTLVRNLEMQFNKNAKTTFLSVKDISILYYPRFEIDERNSRQCFACRLKPCVFNDKVIPCKVDKVLNNLEKWKCSDFNGKTNAAVFELAGATCDDCASLFENDILTEINKVLTKHPKAKLKILSERK